MTNELPLYDADCNCPKCGHEEVTTRFCDAVWPYCSIYRLGQGEHFHRCCTRCHYKWLERCLAEVAEAEATKAERERYASLEVPEPPRDETYAEQRRWFGHGVEALRAAIRAEVADDGN